MVKKKNNNKCLEAAQCLYSQTAHVLKGVRVDVARSTTLIQIEKSIGCTAMMCCCGPQSTSPYDIGNALTFPQVLS